MWEHDPIFGQGTYEWDGKSVAWDHWGAEEELHDFLFIFTPLFWSLVRLPVRPEHWVWITPV